MAVIKPELKLILDKYGINANDKTQCWDCHGTLVLYHKAFEIIAAKESIKFGTPTIIREGRDDAVILVEGTMGDRTEWSFGEAVVGQNYKVSANQAAYPWAMSEKRAKDRVVAKLVGLAGYVYSEDEADDFKDEANKRPLAGQNASPPSPQGSASTTTGTARNGVTDGAKTKDDPVKGLAESLKRAYLAAQTQDAFNKVSVDPDMDLLERESPPLYAEVQALAYRELARIEGGPNRLIGG